MEKIMMKDGMLKTGLLSLLFSLIIGSFWILGSLQEPVFYHMVGREFHPQVNVISFFIIFPFLLGYLFFLGKISKYRLFLTCVAFYACFFSVSALLLLHPSLGLANDVADKGRLLGWALYAVTKTYGSILVTIFWSFATSLSSLEEAKKSFPWIFFCGQVGSLIGSSLVRYSATQGAPFLFGCAVACMVGIMFLITALHRYYPLKRTVDAPFYTSVFEGVRLLMVSSYLKHVFVVSTAFLVVTAFVDYQMHYLAHATYTTLDTFTAFKGWYGQVVNLFTLLFSLLATRPLLRLLGLHATLLLYPLVTIALIALVFFSPTLFLLVFAMVLLRGLSFALNNPAKEMLYIGQSSDVRFKAKSWIDMVGYRIMFAIGSQMICFVHGSFEDIVLYSTVFSLGVVGVWLYSVASLSHDLHNIRGEK